MDIILNFKGSEALECVQQVYPNTWKEKIEEGKSLIKSAMRLFNTDALDAYNRFRRKGCEPHDSIIALAAVQVMNNDMMEWTIKKIQSEQERISLQQTALENATTYDSKDKATIRGYYNGKQAELAERLEQLIAAIPVIDAQSVIHQSAIDFDQAG